MVTPENVALVADCLITALQLAQPIITDKPHATTRRAQLDSMMRQTTLAQITTCLNSAQKAFPDAESFHAPSG